MRDAKAGRAWPVNKSDLTEAIVSRMGLPRKRAESVVNLMFDEMTGALTRSERIEIRGFGSFVAKQYRARTGRNPRTGETIPVPAKRRQDRVAGVLELSLASSADGHGASLPLRERPSRAAVCKSGYA